MLIEGLVARGIEVTLFHAPVKHTTGETQGGLTGWCQEDPASYEFASESLSVSGVLERAQDFEIIHSHLGFLPITYCRLVSRPILTTVHGVPPARLLPIYRKYDGKAYYVSLSNAERSPELSYIATIRPAVDLASAKLTSDPAPYLLTCGPIHAEAGIGEAIQIADATHTELVIAGAIQDERYFEQEIGPKISGRQVRYLDGSGPERRQELLGNALAMLHLGQSFNHAVPEANACGTPAIAGVDGAMKEIVRNGLNGFLVADVAEAIRAVRDIGSISRSDCRKVTEESFSAERMVDEYLSVYERILAETGSEERRPWGYYEILSDSADHKVKRLVVWPGKRLSLQRHKHRAEHWTIVSGEPLVTVDDTETHLSPGDSIAIPLGARHRIANPGETDVVFIEVQTGASFAENDIERVEDDFGRVP